MPQAIVDPSELRRFALSLKKFNAEFQHALTVLHGQLSGLGDTWRDQEQRKFTEVFEQTLKVLNVFLENSHLHASFLSKKAAAIEAYLKQR